MSSRQRMGSYPWISIRTGNAPLSCLEGVPARDDPAPCSQRRGTRNMGGPLSTRHKIPLGAPAKVPVPRNPFRSSGINETFDSKSQISRARIASKRVVCGEDLSLGTARKPLTCPPSLEKWPHVGAEHRLIPSTELTNSPPTGRLVYKSCSNMASRRQAARFLSQFKLRPQLASRRSLSTLPSSTSSSSTFVPWARYAGLAAFGLIASVPLTYAMVCSL